VEKITWGLRMNQYDTTIGLEIHVQLKTKSKMFCRSSAQYFGSAPNTHTCEVCLGLPGALPVINREAINAAMRFSLGLNCKISPKSKFDRKNYFYPDLAKGYQITQFDLPIGVNGWVEVSGKKIRINRSHQEEDTGKLIHTSDGNKKTSLIDFNRSGVPLIEVVSEPDIDSPEQARAYAKKIHQIARYLEVAEVDMEKAGMRFDANISVKKKGVQKLGVKVEIKNINSFRFLERSIAYEIVRQVRILESGGRIIHETRGWVESKAITVTQRKKEISPDYRYFPEPDLPPMTFSNKQSKEVFNKLPEMPDAKTKRFETSFGLSKISAQNITEDTNLAQWFENALTLYSKSPLDLKEKAHTLSNWVEGELFRKMKEKSQNIVSVPIEPAGLVELLYFLDKGDINQQTAKRIFSHMFEAGKSATTLIKEQGLSQLSNRDDLKKLILKVLQENPKAIEDFQKGKQTSIGFLIGAVMKKTAGKANPSLVSEILRKELSDGD